MLWAFALRFFICLCCEHLQRVCCQIDENVFLICWCFFYLHVFSEVAARWTLSATEDLSCSICLPLAHADDVLFFYRNVRHVVRVNRCHHRTVYTHVVAKFIRSMSHSVTCNDLIGLLKSCSVFWALNMCISSTQINEVISIFSLLV